MEVELFAETKKNTNQQLILHLADTAKTAMLTLVALLHRLGQQFTSPRQPRAVHQSVHASHAFDRTL